MNSNFEKKNNFGGGESPAGSLVGGSAGRDVVIYNINNGNINNGVIQPAKGTFVNSDFDSGWWNWSKWR